MNSNFRDNADHGVWCALLLPISIGVSNLKFSTESLSSSPSFYLSTSFGLYSLYLANTFRIFPFSETSQNENKVFEKTFGSWFFVAASAIVQFSTVWVWQHSSFTFQNFSGNFQKVSPLAKAVLSFKVFCSSLQVRTKFFFWKLKMESRGQYFFQYSCWKSNLKRFALIEFQKNTIWLF